MTTRLAALLALVLYPGAVLAGVTERLAPALDTTSATLAEPSHPQVPAPLVRDEAPASAGGFVPGQSKSSNDVILDAQRRKGDMAVEARFIGGYALDAQNPDARADDSRRVKGLYADVQHGKHPFRARIGRQAGDTGGVLGRFDGAMLSYRLQPALQLNAVSGFPVYSSSDAVRTERLFRGIGVDLGAPGDAWNFVAFLMEQAQDGTLERRAAGGEARYTDSVKSLFSYVDYDIRNGELDALLLLGAWKLPFGVAVHGSVDLRRAPILGAYNAIRGRGRESIEVLRTRFDEHGTLRSVADDDTTIGNAYSIGLDKRLNARLRIGGELALAEIKADERRAIRHEPHTEARAERAGKLQLIGNDVRRRGEALTFGVERSETGASTTLAFALDLQSPSTHVWNITRRLRAERRDGRGPAARQWVYAQELVMERRLGKQQRIEVQTGTLWSQSRTADADRAVQLQAAYRLDF